MKRQVVFEFDDETLDRYFASDAFEDPIDVIGRLIEEGFGEDSSVEVLSITK